VARLIAFRNSKRQMLSKIKLETNMRSTKIKGRKNSIQTTFMLRESHKDP
jgi:hypothetical protein